MQDSRSTSTRWPSPVRMPMLQRGEDADDQVQAGVVIGDGERHHEGRIATPPVQPHGAPLKACTR